MRLFIAINFKLGTISRLMELRDELRAQSVRGRFSPPENMHLTLAFLGECDKRQLTAARSAMDEMSFIPFPVSVERIGRFKRDGGDIWWAGVKASDALIELQGLLTEKLNTRGFSLDSRLYSPHITLGRDVELDPSPLPGGFSIARSKPEVVSLNPARAIEPFWEMVKKIDLMKSERVAGKLTYTPVYSKIGQASYQYAN